MGERERNRASVEAMASAIKQHNEQRGVRMTSGEAKEQAASAARDTDNKREAGALRNKRRRAPKPPPEAPGKPSGRIFIDLSKKG